MSLNYNTTKKLLKFFSLQRSVKTTIKILYDKGFFDIYANADKVIEDFSFTTR